MIVSRVAPTPSGYLHAGNAVNFILTARYVASQDGQLLLRIDDADSVRNRSEYVDDIFRTLDWLGIAYSSGPRDAQELAQKYSQVHQRSSYYQAVEQLLDQQLAYGCVCSRKQARAWQTGAVTHTCRHRGAGFLPDGTIRFRRPQPESSNDDQPLGDFVVWRRDNLPAYQLVSVVSDQDLGVNTIVRGCDLWDSSQAQRVLAKALDARTVQLARYFHHPLLTGSDGTKLAKSNAAPPLRDPDAASKDELYAMAASLYERTFSDSAEYRLGGADNLSGERSGQGPGREIPS